VWFFNSFGKGEPSGLISGRAPCLRYNDAFRVVQPKLDQA